VRLIVCCRIRFKLNGFNMFHQLRPRIHGHAIFWHLLSRANVNRCGSTHASDNRCIAIGCDTTQPSARRREALFPCGADRQVFYRASFPPIVSLTTHVQLHRRDFLWRRWIRTPLLRRRVSDAEYPVKFFFNDRLLQMVLFQSDVDQSSSSQRGAACKRPAGVADSNGTACS